MARRQKRPRRPEKPRFRINHQIRVPKIRLVGENLAEISNAVGREVTSDVYPTRDALKMADAIDMDLIEISPNADPPVCRITDYKKFLFDKKKKEKEMKAKTVKTVIKEIRFGPNTDDHDFDFKARHGEKFLKEGAKVKAYVHFRGRTIVFKERGEVLLLRFVKHLEEFGTIESMPRMEGRRMFVLIAPKKSALKASKKPKSNVSKSDKKKDKSVTSASKDTPVKEAIKATGTPKDTPATKAPKTTDVAKDAPVKEAVKAKGTPKDTPATKAPKTTDVAKDVPVKEAIKAKGTPKETPATKAPKTTDVAKDAPVKEAVKAKDVAKDAPAKAVKATDASTSKADTEKS